MSRQFTFSSIILLLALSFSACSPQRYLQDSFALSEGQADAREVSFAQPRLQPGDRFTLSVWGHENLGVGSSFSVYNATESTGRFLVLDKDGMVNLPLIGEINLAGLSQKETKSELIMAYSEYVKQPVIEVRFLGLVYSVLGEAGNPGNFELPSQGRNVAQAIAQAGGFSDDADLTRISLLRKNAVNGHEEITLNLGKKGNYQAQATMIQNGDVLFIPARRSKHNDRFFARLGSYVGAIGAGILVFSTVSR